MQNPDIAISPKSFNIEVPFEMGIGIKDTNEYVCAWSLQEEDDVIFFEFTADNDEHAWELAQEKIEQCIKDSIYKYSNEMMEFAEDATISKEYEVVEPVE